MLLIWKRGKRISQIHSSNTYKAKVVGKDLYGQLWPAWNDNRVVPNGILHFPLFVHKPEH